MLSRLFAFGFAELVHKSRKVKFSGVLGTLLSKHELIYFLDHIKIFVEDFTLVDNRACYLATHIAGALGN